jgi:hypothetical protein
LEERRGRDRNGAIGKNEKIFKQNGEKREEINMKLTKEDGKKR